MNNGDDIHNLLKTLGHDAGLYQDLAQYNASRAALRRAAMVRPAASVPAAPVTPIAAMSPPMAEPLPTPAAPASSESSSLSVILHRLSSPNEAPPSHGRGHHATNGGPASFDAPARQPTRLDRLFGRLSGR